MNKDIKEIVDSMNHDMREISDPKLREHLDGIDFSNARPWKDVLDELEYKWEHRKWYEKVWDKIWFNTFFHFKPSQLRWYWTQIECYFIRAKHGWSYMDTWGFDRYLSDIISGGVKEIRKVHYGHPCDITDEQWTDILDKIAFTFDLAKRVHDEHLVWLLREDFESEEEYLEQKEHYLKLEQEDSGLWKMVSDEDMEKYKEGWRLFQKYYFSLWD